jgi:uncharacterized protein with PQ loop repeat
MVFISELNKLKPDVFYIGLAATIIGIISYLPVVATVHKTRVTSNFPYSTLVIALLSNTLWMIYGLTKNATATIIMGSLYFAIYLYILYVKMTKNKS